MLAQDEYAYNDSLNRSTSTSPFQILYGLHPRGVYELRYLGQLEKRSADEEDFAARISELQEKLRKDCRKVTQSTK